MEEKKQKGSRKKFPLPPRSTGEDKPSTRRQGLRRVGSAATKGLQRAAGAPGQLMQRVNEELYKRNAELAVRNKTLALLRKLDEISLATIDIKEMAEKMSAAITEALGYEIVSIALVDEHREELRWLSVQASVEWMATALQAIPPENITAPLADGLLAVKAIQEEKPYHADKLTEVFPEAVATALAEAASAQDNITIQHTMLYPLRFGRQVLGLLTLSSSRSPENISRYEKESVIGIVGLVALALYKADIYEDLQETSAKLESANKQLQEVDKAKSEFLSIASHQLYTPLTALRGYLSMLQEGDFGEISDKQQPVFEILNTSTEKLITLIKNLLDISRIESGRLELNLESINLVKVTDELVQQLYPNAVAKGLKLAFHSPPANFPHVVADEQRLRQVMLNFIDNAIKYTEKGNIKIELKHSGEDVIFSVTDTGKGLSQDDIVRLFHKFTRVGGSSRFHTEGTGLGLYVAKQIVSEHRGEVEVTSPGVGKGSTFAMRLPVEGASRSLKVGEKASVVIKAADAEGKDTHDTQKSGEQSETP